MENNMGEPTDTTKPRIYVACLAAYNEGYLHGAWIDADQDAWAIQDEINTMLRASPIPDAEEWAIHDYEGFEGLHLSEYAGIESVTHLAAFVAEHGRLGAELVTYYGSLDEARDAMADHYAGEYASLADFAQDITEETTAIPETLRHYIDYDRMARDMAISDVVAIHTAHDAVHIFWSR
jgi:antirestriction protein